uniref:NADH-ubiquinone oxidoreductase chain 5 n=1 Tax=Lepinotus reticulatus TaxID=209981 RepID=A0A3Q8LY69_9NEOP|nr:NADH dehydrogenase subunit 5 [Lepinotus reticulatus]
MKVYSVFSCLLFMMSIFFFLLGLVFLKMDVVYLIEWSLMNLNSLNVQLIVLLDWMSLFFLGLVTYISCLIVNYSKSYMSGDNNYFLFVILIIMFVFSMMLLIVSPNMVSILLGWDGLGLVSYLLVIYYQNVKSYNAGLITVLSNRIGDVMILISIGLMFNCNSWNYFFYIDYYVAGEFELIGWFLIIAGMTKSAQIPFSSWLPAAMAAPTPVSALVHSSTLVTAGVYLLIRFSHVFLNVKFSNFLLIISGMTMFMAGLSANFEYDLKKIIALSTLSQLGLMMSTLAMGLTKICFFHLLSHALFKALLFMCAGFVIHGMGDCQDIRYMGGLGSQIPVVMVFFNTANLSLCGIPFLSGFYSKDLILEMISSTEVSIITYFLIFFSSALTISYSFRLFSYMMMGSWNLFSMSGLEDKDFIMWKSMFGLYMGSLWGGCMLIWLMFPLVDLIYLPVLMKLLMLMMTIIFVMLSIEYYLGVDYDKWLFKLSVKTFVSSSMWLMPYLSTFPLIKLIMSLSKYYLKYIDLGWMEVLGGQGIKSFLMNFSKFNYMYQGIVYKSYLFFFIYLYILVLLIWMSI